MQCACTMSNYQAQTSSTSEAETETERERERERVRAAILFLCTCLGDLASLARPADRADPEVCSNALLAQTQARPAITPCVLPLSSQVFPFCFFLSDSAITWPPVCEKQNEPNLGSGWCKHF